MDIPDLFHEYMEAQEDLVTAMTKVDNLKESLMQELTVDDKAYAIEYKGKVYRIGLSPEATALTVEELPFYPEKKKKK